MKKSGLLQRQAENRAEAYSQAQHIERQLMFDTAQIALHKLGWGYDRICRFSQVWMELREYYTEAFRPENPEADVYREHFDAEIADILKDKAKLVPFDERYPEVKIINGTGKWVQRR